MKMISIFFSFLLIAPSLFANGNVLKGNGQNQITITNGNGQNVAKISAPPPVWPFGLDGAFSCSGATVHLAQGVTKDYSSFTMTNCTLIIDQGDAWTIIGVKGNFTMDATSVIQDLNNNSVGETLNRTAPDGTFLSFNIAQWASGPGGGSGGCACVAGGGDADTGGGGGGGGGSPGGTASSAQTGVGANSTNEDPGGASINLIFDGYGLPGNAGANNSFTGGGGGCAVGAGGSGASKGFHGGPVYIKVAGTISVPASVVVIDAHGGDGAAGGPGGCGGQDVTGSSLGGGGGGGSAGGDGGKVQVRYKSGSFATNNVNILAGNHGVGGAGGGFGCTGASPGPNCGGDAGGDGGDGSVGITDIAAY